ncbi:nitroreductase family protein [Acetivibrio sp. MSJd-27]|uniref:nitroreductase family protein n=1 Tax=Acetivibrio sp. MSJd-27 TaxID=2841523 RepID=UPI001C1092EE|nr:nitroreductase family protein [Acetivibrio sp. MSJd-27]MBU5450215.1 nitroreductase family protein [Acetivibrio sp. MSJd-27]
MSAYTSILNRRTIRKFTQQPIEQEKLVKMINAARLAPSGANLQPLKYVVVTDKNLLEEVFRTTKWAAYIAPHGTPKEGEKPTAYIVVLVDTAVRKDADNDASAAIENILLTAEDDEIGTCWIGSVDRKTLAGIVRIPEGQEIHSVIAMGYKAQESEATEMENGDVKYYMDEHGAIHVPKRKLSDIVRFL